MSKRIHGLWNHPLYNTYNGMMQRCYNEKRKCYRWYGARGIKVCEKWKNNPQEFINWALENEWKPKLQVDRIDSNKDYCPENCRIVTKNFNVKSKRYVSYVKKSNNLPIGVRFKLGKYEAAIKNNGHLYYLGRFNSSEEASLAYQEAKRKFGIFN